MQKGQKAVSVNIKGGSSAKKRFPFCKRVPLKYDSLDYFFIPARELQFQLVEFLGGTSMPLRSLEKWKWMRATLVAGAKDYAVVERPGKYPFSAY